MYPSRKEIIKSAIIISAVLALVILTEVKAFGQMTISSTRVSTSSASIIKAPQGQPPNLDQCSNGQFGSPVLTCTGANWQNGNLNSINSQWIEGQGVAYRLRLTGQTIGAPATYRLEFDSTISAKHAIDYLMTYSADAPGADPCSGLASCDPNSATTFDIPLDFKVKAGQDGIVGTTDDLTQKPGVFTVYGGSMVSTSAYMLSGAYSGTSATAIDVTIVPTQSDVVIAWSGHIATRMDWGVTNSAVNLTGSPYHMRSLTGGNQDRSMSLDSIVFPGQITIVKEVYGNGGLTSSNTAFSFTASNFGTNGFSLIDANVVGPDRKTQSIVVGAGTTTVTINEIDTLGWNISEIKCSSASGGLPVDLTNTTIVGNTMTIGVEEAEVITCTTKSSQLGMTAAEVSLAGSVVTDMGTPIKGAMVSVMNANTLETITVKSNNFGNFVVPGLPAGDFYIVNVSHPRYIFQTNTQSLTLDDVFEGMVFIGRK